MLDIVPLDRHPALLQTRAAGGHRDTAIAGALFLLAAIASFVGSLLTEEPGRSLVLPWVVTLALGVGYLTAWVRPQVASASDELAEAFMRSASR
jgi:hypothetical protein